MSTFFLFVFLHNKALRHILTTLLPLAADTTEIMFYFLRSDSGDTTAHLQIERSWVMFAPSKQ